MALVQEELQEQEEGIWIKIFSSAPFFSQYQDYYMVVIYLGKLKAAPVDLKKLSNVVYKKVVKIIFRNLTR